MREFRQKGDLNLLPAGYRSEARPKKIPAAAIRRAPAPHADGARACLRVREKHSHRFSLFPPLLPAGLAAAVQKRDHPVALGLGGDVARDGMTGHRTGIGGCGARISFHG
jgi:hypothetical protein